MYQIHNAINAINAITNDSKTMLTHGLLRAPLFCSAIALKVNSVTYIIAKNYKLSIPQIDELPGSELE